MRPRISVLPGAKVSVLGNPSSVIGAGGGIVRGVRIPPRGGWSVDVMVNPGGGTPAQPPERSSEQSVAEREAYRTGCGSLRQPGFGGKVEGQNPGKLRCPGIQLLKTHGWDNRRGGADCSCEG